MDTVCQTAFTLEMINYLLTPSSPLGTFIGWIDFSHENRVRGA